MEDCMSFAFRTVDQHSDSCIISKKKHTRERKEKRDPCFPWRPVLELLGCFCVFFSRDVSSAGFLKSTLAPTSPLKVASLSAPARLRMWARTTRASFSNSCLQPSTGAPFQVTFFVRSFLSPDCSEGFTPVASEQRQRRPLSPPPL